MHHRSSRRLVCLIAVALAATTSAARARVEAQAPPPAPQQPAIPQIAGGRVEQVTVDVVVLDRKGQPVTGLTRDDFTVLEEGQAKTLASFDVVDHTPGTEVAPPPPPAPVSTNVGKGRDEAQPGRTFVILFDDLNLTITNVGHAKKAVTAFLDRGAVEGDKVTLFTTSGTAWWSTEMKAGRDDIVAILKRLDGRRVLETASERITDYEAYQIIYYRDVLVAARVQDRMERYGTKLLQAPDKANAQNAMTVFQRGVIDPFVESLALQTYMKSKVRLEATLETIERATRALTEGRSRKALLLVSEGFIDVPSEGAPRRIVEAARRVNATLYFIDAAGLKALDPMYSAEFGPALDSRDTMTAIADLSREAEGAAALADRTGGFSIRGNNNFEEGAVRIGRESQSYYLLGYNPGDIPKDGRFRKIDVKVRGNYTVRARRGYYAPSPEGETPYKPSRDVDPVLQQALDSAQAEDAIPLRLTAYVMGETGLNRTKVVLAADADVSKVDFPEVSGQPRASLDTLAVIAHRDSGDALRADQKVEIQRKPGAAAAAGPMWYSFLREFEVAAGEHQAKLIVRDLATNRVGTVIHRFSVPAQDQFRVSTPVLTDTLSDTGGGPTPVLLARRAFPQSAQLYVRFDVFGAAKGKDGLPRVRAGHSLRRDNLTIGRATPSLIEPTSLGAIARLVQIPLRAFPPGEYELVLNVTDEVTGIARELVEPFTITPTATASR